MEIELKNYPYKKLLSMSHGLISDVNNLNIGPIEKQKALSQVAFTFLHSYLEHSAFIARQFKMVGAPSEFLTELDNINDRHFLMMFKEIEKFRDGYFTKKADETAEDDAEDVAESEDEKESKS